MFNVTCLLVIVYSAKVRRLPEPVRKVCRFLHVKYVKSLGLEALDMTCMWESITEDRIRSNLSKTKNIPPKALIFSDFCCTFAMSLMILLVLICSTKI